jgi:hypothetical protein
LGFLALYFRAATVLKPAISVHGIPLYQHPFGDETYLQNVFQFAFAITAVLILALGYETEISSQYFEVLFKGFLFLITFTFIASIHLALNKLWVTARIELQVKVPVPPPEEFQTDEFSFLAPASSEKTYVLWSPTQQKFDKFSILNLVVFICFLVAISIEMISQTVIPLLPIQLPGTSTGQIWQYSLSLFTTLALVIEPIFFYLVVKRLHDEIYAYKVEELVPLLVKLEPDNAARERLVKFLERILEFRQFGI